MRLLCLNLFLCFFFSSVVQLQAQDEKPLVVATASIFADMAEVIGGDLIDVQSIVPIGGDPHIYEPTPKAAKLAADADLILRNGLTFEGWLNELIDNSGTEALIVKITEGIDPIESSTYENSSDPHAWMDAQNGLIYFENIKNALSQIDSSNADIYEFNYNVYRQQLIDVDTFIERSIRSIPLSQRILITSHDAFRYYGNRYGIKVEALLGTSTDAEEQTSDVIRLSKVIKENNIPAVFIESTVNPKVLKQLATDNKVVIGGQLFSDSIGDEESDAPTYLEMLKYNTTTIVNALTREMDDQQLKEAQRESSGNYLYYLVAVVALLGIVLIGAQLSK
ncbi:MAG: zinc ABC transporter substrate-binding protein [Bacteroidota bacterium]